MLFNRFDKRRKVLRRAACLAALVCLPTVAVSANETATLLNPIGTNRIIYVCLDGAADDAPLAVSKTYNKIDWNGFSERDLLVFEVKEKMIHLVTQDETSWQRTAYANPAQALTRRINCRGALEYVLIGKDGGEKMRWQGNLPRRALFDTIDAMPMRQYEMRQSEKRRGLR